jgi:pyrroloquinoline quinone biosynthesis protein D
MGETSASGGTGRVRLEHVPRVHPETAVSKVGGRWMAATPDDRLHTFEHPDGSVSEVGERIVELVDGVRSVGAIVDVLVDEFEVSREQAEADTLQFIELLVQKQVLVV